MKMVLNHIPRDQNQIKISVYVLQMKKKKRKTGVLSFAPVPDLRNVPLFYSCVPCTGTDVSRNGFEFLFGH
jgi:hypothetical protein